MFNNFVLLLVLNSNLFFFIFYCFKGSGKTFTLYGDANGGLIHFAAKDLFNLTMKNQNVLITLSYLQVYMDHVIDLLGLDVRKYLLLKVRC